MAELDSESRIDTKREIVHSLRLEAADYLLNHDAFWFADDDGFIGDISGNVVLETLQGIISIFERGKCD